ncbi:MAG: hypothetical protein M0Z50_01450 [Planctomycetia bacterium]|nr:hypothetical protein [Planctomycetia bacterium]
MDFLSLHSVCLILAVVSLAPLALYIIRPRQDPFNPLIFVAALGFAMTDRRLLFNPGPALDYLPPWAYKEFIFMVIVSLLGLYAGWFGWSLVNRHYPPSPIRTLADYRRQYDPNRLLAFGLAYTVIALFSFALTYHRYHATGYLRDLMYMNGPAIVLLIQAAMLDGTLSWVAIPAICAGLTRNIVKFFAYGSRGMTAQAVFLLLTPFLLKGTRPRKVLVLGLAAVFGITMLTLTRSRYLLGEGYAPNRVQAVVMAAEQMFNGRHQIYDAGSAVVGGAAAMQAVQHLDNYDWGGFIWNVLATFPPHEWFPNKGRWQTPWSAGGWHGYLYSIRVGSGVPIPNGSGTGGFGDMYVNFWWFCPLFWFLLGYVMHYLYAGAVRGRRMDFQGYLFAMYIMVLFLVSQGGEPAVFNFLFGFCPLFIAYPLCRFEAEIRHFPTRPGQVAN